MVLAVHLLPHKTRCFFIAKYKVLKPKWASIIIHTPTFNNNKVNALFVSVVSQIESNIRDRH
jgi:hypothetical protein